MVANLLKARLTDIDKGDALKVPRLYFIAQHCLLLPGTEPV